MAYWECTQCGSMQGKIGLFRDKPDECDVCGNTEFEAIGMTESTLLMFGFDLGNFVKLCFVLVVFNIVGGIIGWFFGGSLILIDAIVTIVILSVVAYGVSRGTRAGWIAALVVFGLAFLGGVGFIVGFIIGSIPIEVLDDFGGPTALLYVFQAIVFGALGLAMLIGGREELSESGGTAT